MSSHQRESADRPDATLRLRGVESGEALSMWRRQQEARERIARENTLASRSERAIDPTDPRWVLAARTRAMMDGPILTPERRERLLRLGVQLGLRRFDANVVIALVQDQARSGSEIPIEHEVLRLVTPVEQVRTFDARREVIRWGAAIACALTATILLIWWIVGRT